MIPLTSPGLALGEWLGIQRRTSRISPMLKSVRPLLDDICASVAVDDGDAPLILSPISALAPRAFGALRPGGHGLPVWKYDNVIGLSLRICGRPKAFIGDRGRRRFVGCIRCPIREIDNDAWRRLSRFGAYAWASADSGASLEIAWEASGELSGSWVGSGLATGVASGVGWAEIGAGAEGHPATSKEAARTTRIRIAQKSPKQQREKQLFSACE